MGGLTLERFRREYDEETVIFEEGDLGDTVFLIEEGTVKILKETDERRTVVTRLGNGDIVGEMGLREEHHQRTATVRAETDVTGWKLPCDEFRSIIDRHEDFRHRLITALINRLDDTTRELTGSLDREEVLLDYAKVTLSLLGSEEWEDEENTRTLEIDSTSEYLAYRFGTSAQVMERFLSVGEEDSLDRFDEEERDNLLSVAKRIIDRGLNNLDVSVDSRGEPDSQLVEATRKAREYLDDLESDEELDDEDLRTILEQRKPLRSTLEDRKQAGRDDYVVELLEKSLNGIDREINRLRNH